MGSYFIFKSRKEEILKIDLNVKMATTTTAKNCRLMSHVQKQSEQCLRVWPPSLLTTSRNLLSTEAVR